MPTLTRSNRNCLLKGDKVGWETSRAILMHAHRVFGTHYFRGKGLDESDLFW